MKKTLLALGLVFCASAAVAQVTFPVKVGFEGTDPTNLYHCPFRNSIANDEGIADYVNFKEGDEWNEAFDEAKVGLQCFSANNAGDKANAWDRGFKLANLPIQDGKSYRVSFWVKGETGKVMKAYLSKGVEQLDLSFVNAAGNAVYGMNGSNDYTFTDDEWHHVTFMAYYGGAEAYNKVLESTSWRGNGILGKCVPESLWEAAGIDSTNSTANYRTFFNEAIPEKFFAIWNIYDAGNFYLDDIVIEEDKYFGQASVNGNVIKLDFGYDTNIASLANAEKKRYLKMDKSQFKVVSSDAEVEITAVEAQTDGYVYIFLPEYLDADATVSISFTPNDECPLLYGENKRPSFESGDLKVFGFENEVAYLDESVSAESHYSEAPDMLSCTPANGAFDLPLSTRTFTFTFDQAIDLAYSHVYMFDEFETKTVLTLSAGETDSILVATSDKDLKKGTYTFDIEACGDYDSYFCNDYVISVGYTEYDPDNSITNLFDADFASGSTDKVPQNGSMIANSDGTTTLEPGSGKSSGPRLFTDFAAGGQFTAALYLRDWADGYYYEIGTREDQRLTLTPGKNVISFIYANWKGTSQTLKVEVFPISEDGEAGANIAEETFTEVLNVNGGKAAVSNAPEGKISLRIDEEGNYGIRFKGTGEYLLANIVVNNIPEIAGVEYKSNLYNTVVAAGQYYNDIDPLEEGNERYNVVQFANLEEIVNKYYSMTDETITDWSEFNMTNADDYAKAVEEVNSILETAKTFKTTVDAFDALRIDGGKVSEILTENEGTKYENLECYSILKNTYDEYKDKALIDLDSLRAATDLLKNNLFMLRMMTGKKTKTTGEEVADWETPGKVGVPALTERIDIAVATIEAMEAELADSEWEVMDQAANALTDDDNIANALKKIATKYYYKAMLNDEDATNFFNKTTTGTVEGEESEPVTTTEEKTYNFSFFLKNPMIYVKTSPDKNNHASSLDKINVGTEEEPVYEYSGSACPGWVISEGTAGWSNGWGALAWNEEIAEGAMASNWGGSFTISQTIEDLPAGLYILKAGITERNGASDATDAESAFFWQTSEDMEYDDRQTMMIPSSGQSWATENISTARRDAEYDATGHEITKDEEGAEIEAAADAEPIEILDGKLTIGAHAGPSSHVFINNFSIYLVGKSKSVKYDEIYTGIETPKASQVKVAVYDVNGRQVVRAAKGVNIVKRTYSDGSVKVAKYIVK